MQQLPNFIAASIAGSRSTAPLNRSNSVLIAAPCSISDLCYLAPYTKNDRDWSLETCFSSAILLARSRRPGTDAPRCRETIEVSLSGLARRSGTPVVVGRSDCLKLYGYDLACSHQAVRIRCVHRPPRLQHIKVWLYVVNRVARQRDCKGT